MLSLKSTSLIIDTSDSRLMSQLFIIDVDITDDEKCNGRQNLPITSLCDSYSSFDGRVPTSRRSYHERQDNQVISLWSLDSYTRFNYCWVIRWTVVSPAHQGSSPGADIYSGFISRFSAMRVQLEETFPLTTRRLRWLRKISRWYTGLVSQRFLYG